MLTFGMLFLFNNTEFVSISDLLTDFFCLQTSFLVLKSHRDGECLAVENTDTLLFELVLSANRRETSSCVGHSGARHGCFTNVCLYQGLAAGSF